MRGLTSADAGVARRAAAAIARFARAGPAAGRAIAKASGGAAMPALARLAMSGDGAAAGAAMRAVALVVLSHGGGARPALVRAYAATDGAVEAVAAAVMQQAAPVQALSALFLIITDGVPEVSARVAAADGLCARLVSFVAAIGNGPWQPEDSRRFCRCKSAMTCIFVLVRFQPLTAVPALMAAEGFWPAVEAVLARPGSSTAEADTVDMVLGTLLVMAEHSPAASRIAAGRDGLLVGLAAALTRPGCRERAESVLWGVATRGDGKAAVAAAVAGALASAADEATRQQLREWLAARRMQMDAAAVGALERKALEAAALHARVAELEAIPVNTRAAIVELAQAVRRKRPREAAAAGEEQQQPPTQKQDRKQRQRQKQKRKQKQKQKQEWKQRQ